MSKKNNEKGNKNEDIKVVDNIDDKELNDDDSSNNVENTEIEIKVFDENNKIKSKDMINDDPVNKSENGKIIKQAKDGEYYEVFKNGSCMWCRTGAIFSEDELK